MICGLLLFALLCPGQTLQAGQNVAIKSIQADFSQEKQLPILAHPLLAKGIFLFQAPDSLRWEYQQPLPVILLMDHGKIRKFVQKNGILTEEHGQRVDAMQVVLSEIQGWLKGQITDNATFSCQQPDPQTITLTPKDKGLTAIISAIELKLSTTHGLLDTVTIYEGPDSFTRLSFSNRILNKPIARTRFQQP